MDILYQIEDAEFASLKASFSNMKKMEQEIYIDGRTITPGFEFVRKGSSKDSEDFLSNNDKNLYEIQQAR